MLCAAHPTGIDARIPFGIELFNLDGVRLLGRNLNQYRHHEQSHGRSRSRSLIANGELRTRIERDGLKGVTSNPSIFEKAIGESDENAIVVVKAAQASGDLHVLVERGRRTLRVHLKDVDAGLAELARAIDIALE